MLHIEDIISGASTAEETTTTPTTKTPTATTTPTTTGTDTTAAADGEVLVSLTRVINSLF